MEFVLKFWFSEQLVPASLAPLKLSSPLKLNLLVLGRVSLFTWPELTFQPLKNYCNWSHLPVVAGYIILASKTWSLAAQCLTCVSYLSLSLPIDW